MGGGGKAAKRLKIHSLRADLPCVGGIICSLLAWLRLTALVRILLQTLVIELQGVSDRRFLETCMDNYRIVVCNLSRGYISPCALPARVCSERAASVALAECRVPGCSQ